MVRNEINKRTGQPVALGFDAINGHTYANKELFLNMIAYLTDDAGLINARSKEVKVRPLDKEKIRDSAFTWQAFNLGFPLGLVILLGVAKVYLRKKKFGIPTSN